MEKFGLEADCYCSIEAEALSRYRKNSHPRSIHFNLHLLLTIDYFSLLPFLKKNQKKWIKMFKAMAIASNKVIIHTDYGSDDSDDFTDDPFNSELYQRVLSQGTEKDRSIRINVVGNYHQGKTTLTKLLTGQDTKGVQSTNSVEINHCKYFENHDAVAFCFNSSASNENGIHRRIAALVQVEQNRKDSSTFKDCLDFSLSKTENANLSQEGKDSIRATTGKESLTSEEFREISNLLKQNQSGKSDGDGDLQIWDFGGQYIFYATHTLFLSKGSVYLMVFDLTKKLSDVIEDPEFPDESVDKNIQQYAEYWMNSIHSYVGSDDGLEPPVILVGTHKDKLDGDEIMKEKLKDEYFDNIRKLFEDTLIINHIHKKDFAIDCTNLHEKNIVALREEIIRLCSNSKEKKIPARWISLEKSLLTQKHKKIILYSDVVAIDSQNEFPLMDKENIRLFLLYHHVKGNLFYFDEEQISAYVVLDTQYLIDAFRCIITSEQFCKRDPEYRRIWKILRQEARLEMTLLERVWGADANSDFMKHKNVLLMFLQRHYILSEALNYDEHTGKTRGLGWYVVPCFLRTHCSDDALKEFLNDRKQTKLRFAMSFHISPIVQHIFYRLIAALIGRWPIVPVQIPTQGKKVLLYENLGAFRLDTNHVGIVELHQSIIDFRVVILCKSSSMNAEVVDMLRRFAVSIVLSEFGKLRNTETKQKKPFEECFRCNHESHFLDGSRQIVSLEKFSLEKFQPCPDMISGHEICTSDARSEWFQDNLMIELANDCELDERQLSKLSKTVGINWQMLGIELGLKQTQIERIFMDNKTTEMQIFKMLKTWVDEKEEPATINTLTKAMKSTKGLSVEWDDVRNIVEEIASKH